MWTAAFRQRFFLAPVVGAVLGVSLALHPGWASAIDDTKCGRVFLTNDQNELLSLRGPSQVLSRKGEVDSAPRPKVLLRSRVPIGGLASGESLIGVDFRPSTGVLYAVGGWSMASPTRVIVGVRGQVTKHCTFRNFLAREFAVFPGISRGSRVSVPPRDPPESALMRDEPRFPGVFADRP